MAPTAISTLIENLDAALDYEAESSVTKAQTVITITNQLLARRPSSMSQEASAATYDVAQLRQLQEDARRFVSANTAAKSGVRFLGPVRGFGRG